MKTPITVLCLFAAGLVVAGCKKTDPPAPAPSTPPPADQTRALPPGHPDISMSGQNLPPGAVAQVTNPEWTVPADWQPGPPSSVRRASYLVKNADGQTADIAVTAFPGDVGGMLANINRWRSQIGLGPITEEEAGTLTTVIEVNGLAASVVDFTGANQRMIVATIAHDGNSWFFKMTGPVAVVEAQQPAFLEFVKSLKF